MCTSKIYHFFQIDRFWNLKKKEMETNFFWFVMNPLFYQKSKASSIFVPEKRILAFPVIFKDALRALTILVLYFHNWLGYKKSALIGWFLTSLSMNGMHVLCSTMHKVSFVSFFVSWRAPTLYLTIMTHQSFLQQLAKFGRVWCHFNAIKG